MTIPPVQRLDNTRRVTSPGMVDTTTADTLPGHTLLKLVLLITEVASVQVLVYLCICVFINLNTLCGLVYLRSSMLV